MWTGTGLAQNAAMTAEDRLSLLYQPRFDYTETGEPIIRVHLKDAEGSIQFTPDQAIKVMPNGDGGPEIRLPGKKPYTVTISEAEAGTYTHHVVVERLRVDEKERLPDLSAEWMERGYVIEPLEKGGLFAMQGRVLDSRILLVSVFKTQNEEEATTIKNHLESQYGIRAGVHSELTEYPKGLLTLKAPGLNVTITSPNVLWVGASKMGKKEIRYTIPNIPKSYGKGFETRTYTGTLVFAPGRGGNLVAMVEVGAEKLLRGVVPSEIYSTAPSASLRAQAIAARNQVYAFVGVRNVADPFMQRSDVMDQVYGGVGKEKSSTTKAVEETRGVVMFRGDILAEVFYSSNSGGFTENNENVWKMEPLPHLRGKPDSPQGVAPEWYKDGISEEELEAFLASKTKAYSQWKPNLYRWTRDATAKQAREWLRKNREDSGPIQDVRILSRGVSGRVIRLEVVGQSATVMVERELNIRRLFGGLRSGLFIMSMKRGADGNVNKFSFRGGGFGHGVGMCQTGAMGMAKEGFSHNDILQHYYSGITIEKLY
jgi:SpoIID/LytB domain protein